MLQILLLGLTLCIVAAHCTVVEDILGLNKKNNEVAKNPGRLTSGGTFRNQIKRQRPPLSAPPYAVPMEPVFKYSQRDPLYEQRIRNITGIESSSISSKADHDAESSHQVVHKVISYKPPAVINPPSHPHPYYIEPPEPIIEIIIKESNESLPAPPTTQTPPPPPSTKEPIHVFYVKYKKNPHPSEHGDDIIYEEPVPALTPHATEIVEGGQEEEEAEPNYGPIYAEPLPSPPPSTTLRTIIRPDSETYHGSGLKVTFGSPPNEGHGEEEAWQSAPKPQVALPENKQDTDVESSTESNKHHYSKRQQGPFPTKQIRQNHPSQPPFIQQENLQYQQVQPSQQPAPTQTSNHRFPVQSQFQYQQSDSRLAFPQQQQAHPTVPQHTDGFQNGQFQGRLQPNAGSSRPLQQKKYPQPEQGPFSTRQPQYNDRTFLLPPQPPQQYTQNGPSLRNQPPTPHQIQEYQRHKEFLHQQSLKQQALQSKQAVPTQQNRFLNSQQVEPQNVQIISNRFPNNQQQFHTQSIPKPENRFQNNQKQADLQKTGGSRFSINQQASLQQTKSQIPHIHVEQSPIIDQSQLSQHLSPQLQVFNQVPTTQNSIPQHYPFETKNYNDGTNYGLRLHGKAPQQSIRNQQDQQPPKQNTFPQREQSNYNPQFLKQETNTRNENRNTENAEIIKSISSLEEHQIQPGYKDAATDQIIPSTPNAPLKQQNDATQLNRNQQQFGFPHVFNQQRPTESRYTIRNNPASNVKQTFNRQPTNTEILNYSIKNGPSSTATPTVIAPTESRYNDRNKYLTVYSRPSHKQPQNNKKTYVSTTAKPEYRIASSVSPSTESPRFEPTPETKEEVTKEEEERKNANIAALPQEVPDDLREQLLSSGILGNADIQILDYDKVGDIPIESLPPEALENFYGAGSAPVPSIVKPNDYKKTVEMRVVRYDPNSEEGQDLSSKYLQENATKIDPVVLNDSKYKRYLPLKVSGSQFPIPDVPQLQDRIVNSVVVLAPVDYDFIKSQEDSEDLRRGRVIQIQGVKFIVGDSLMTVIKEPSKENYKKWLQNELSVPAEHQSVILLVTK